MTVHFVTFGNEKYKNGRRRIVSEARNFPCFNKIHEFTEFDLMSDHDYWYKHGQFILNNPRGYGYWIWKSYVVKKVLDNIKNDDILIYADSGCTLHPSGIQRLYEYFDMVKSSPCGIVSFGMPHLEKKYTKMDVIRHFEAEDLLETGQINATAFIIRKCDHTVKLINLWYESCDNYHLVDDSPSIVPNSFDFIDHRHDQSIFSLIRKKYGTILLEDETWTSPNWDPSMPIWASRLK